jgi:hypothetical protein
VPVPTYRRADDLVPLAEKAMRDYHRDLADAGVTVEVLTVHAGTSPALKHHGYPALAVIKPMSQKDRAAGSADARILIDAEKWDGLDDPRRLALLDHELTHLELVRDEEGAVREDDCGRPKLRTRPHDFELGGFEEVVGRHKASAPESRSFYDAHKVFVQQKFPWGMT